MAGYAGAARAAITAALGDTDGAIELLDEAYRNGYPYSVSLHQTRWWDPLRSIPAFRDVIRTREGGSCGPPQGTAGLGRGLGFGIGIVEVTRFRGRLSRRRRRRRAGRNARPHRRRPSLSRAELQTQFLFRKHSCVYGCRCEGPVRRKARCDRPRESPGTAQAVDVMSYPSLCEGGHLHSLPWNDPFASGCRWQCPQDVHFRLRTVGDIPAPPPRLRWQKLGNMNV